MIELDVVDRHLSKLGYHFLPLVVFCAKLLPQLPTSSWSTRAKVYHERLAIGP